MADQVNALLRYEIFDAPEPSGTPRGDTLGVVYASGRIATKRATYTTTDPTASPPPAMLTPSEAAAPFTIPASPTGSRRVLVRLSARYERILVTIARNPQVVGGSIDPPIPEYAASPGPDPTPFIKVGFDNEPVTLLSLQPGDKIRARADYG